MSSATSDDEYVKRERREYPVRTVAVVIIVDHRERILLVRTKRLPHHWQPPGGGVKPSDVSPDAAAVREVYEEVGIKLASSKIRKFCETSYDFGAGVVHFFIAPAPQEFDIKVNEAELAAWQWVSLEVALTLPMFPATEKSLQFLANNNDILSDAARDVS